jgi:hypothetical protein
MLERLIRHLCTKEKFTATEVPLAVLAAFGTLCVAPEFFADYVFPVLLALLALIVLEFVVRKTVKSLFAVLTGASRRRRHRREAEHTAQALAKSEREAEAQSGVERDARRRRDEARAECLLHFQLHAPDMNGRFGRGQFDEYVRLYMGDDKPPEEVERRAQRLIGLMDGHLEKAGAAGSKPDVAALAAWYQETKAQIEAQPVDDRAKRVQVAQLTARYTELVQQHLEELTP